MSGTAEAGLWDPGGRGGGLRKQSGSYGSKGGGGGDGEGEILPLSQTMTPLWDRSRWSKMAWT